MTTTGKIFKEPTCAARQAALPKLVETHLTHNAAMEAARYLKISKSIFLDFNKFEKNIKRRSCRDLSLCKILVKKLYFDPDKKDKCVDFG